MPPPAIEWDRNVYQRPWESLSPKAVGLWEAIANKTLTAGTAQRLWGRGHMAQKLVPDSTRNKFCTIRSQPPTSRHLASTSSLEVPRLRPRRNNVCPLPLSIYTYIYAHLHISISISIFICIPSKSRFLPFEYRVLPPATPLTQTTLEESERVYYLCRCALDLVTCLTQDTLFTAR
jgi:hypothetical protein